MSELEDFLLVQHQLSYSVTAAITYSAKDKNNTIHKNLDIEAESAHLDFGCPCFFYRGNGGGGRLNLNCKQNNH